MTAEPIDKLKFEYEKRQRRISTIETALLGLRRQNDELQEDWGQAYDRAAQRGLLNSFDPSGFDRAIDILLKEMSALNIEMDNLHEEAAAIEQVLTSKWQ